MLLPRILTAIVGIPFLLFLIHRGGVAFEVFVVAICALCAYEYAMMLRLGGRPVQWMPTVIFGAALAACAGEIARARDVGRARSGGGLFWSRATKARDGEGRNSDHHEAHIAHDPRLLRSG